MLAAAFAGAAVASLTGSAVLGLGAGIGAVPVQLIQALPYVVTVVILAGFVGAASPLALAKPYPPSRMTSSHQKVRLLPEVCAQTSC